MLQSGIWNRVVVSLGTAALEIHKKGAGCITFKNKRRCIEVGEDECAVWFSITVTVVLGSGSACWAEQKWKEKQTILCAKA